ncbi:MULTISPECIES: energy transducer TonB [Sphingobacterium]|uniref:energy transducer TonB n=2 Tax=Sphingobacterium TaxID=28453 RepID=UPI00257963BB|nr:MULTISPECIES: energy transducer TonB [Sphingobacterium]
MRISWIRKLSFMFIVSISILSQSVGQSLVLDDSIADIPPHMIEIFPEPPYGTNGFKNWIVKNYKIPTAAKKAKVNGKLMINFTIEKDGRLSNFQITKDIGYQTAETLIELIKKSSPWKPGYQNGRAVKSGYTYPLSFSEGDLKLKSEAKRQR